MSFGRDYVTPDKACISKEGNGDLPDFGPARYFAGDKGKGLDAVLKASCVTKEQDVNSNNNFRSCCTVSCKY